MKLNFIILLLPAAFALNYLSPRHHHHSKPLSSALGTAPYGSGNGTATFGSSGLLSASTGIAGKAIYSTIVVTEVPATQTVFDSASPPSSKAAAAIADPSTCPQETVTVTEDATVTVTVSAQASGASVIPTQEPVPTQALTSSPVESVTASPKEASSTPLSPTVVSAITLAGVGAESSPVSSTPAVADTSKTVAAAPTVASSSTAAPVIAPTSSAAPPVKASATPSTAPEPATAAAAPAASGSKSPKRGIIVSGHDTDVITAAFANTKVSWLGNWYSGPPPNWTPEMGMEYVPQLYEPKYIDDGSWASNAGKGVKAGDKYFMSFGEPKTWNLAPATGVDLWMKNLQPYAAQGIKLGTPGNLQNPGDMDWLAAFMDGCATAGCDISFVCVHWFWTPGPNGQQDFKNAVNKAISLARGKPVWVDNFGANGDREGQIEFLTNIIPWLEDNDAVERYGYLAINRTSGGFLQETADELSDLGKFYATF